MIYDHTSRDYVKENHRFMSCKTMAENLGCNISNVKQICKRWRFKPLPIKPTGRPKKDFTAIDEKIRNGDYEGISKATKEYRKRMLGIVKVVKKKSDGILEVNKYENWLI